LLRFDLQDRYVLVTVGVSLLPQPQVETCMDDPSPFRRIELAGAIDKNCPVDQVMRFADYLGAQSRYPWTHWSWLGEGHTIPCDAVPESCGGEQFPAALLSKRLPATPPIVWPLFREDPINLLWFLPVSAAEREWAMANSTNELIDRLIENHVDVTICRRQGLALS
jgi:hypothetical protein